MRHKLSLYGSGIHKTSAGHLRYHAPKYLRSKYVHRVQVEKLLEETPYSIRQLLPWPYEVHHLDFNKEHNCPYNLLLVSESLHSVMTGATTAFRFNPKWSPPVQSMLFDEDVPF